MGDVRIVKLTQKEKLENKRDQIIRQLNTIKTAEKKKKRKQETRRKIILGAVIINHMKHDQTFYEEIKNLVEKYASPADKKSLGELLNLTLTDFEKAASPEKIN